MSDRPVERFQPTSGMFVGIAGLVMIGVALVVIVTGARSVGGLRAALLFLVAALLVWMTQLRPRARAYPDRLVLVNAASDTVIPLVLVEELTVRQSLNVFVDEKRYVGIGIGRSMRSILGRRGGVGGGFGMDRLQEYAESSAAVHQHPPEQPYADFVEQRIWQLVDEAKATGQSAEERQVRRTWAVPELAAIGVLLLAFLATFV